MLEMLLAAITPILGVEAAKIIAAGLDVAVKKITEMGAPHDELLANAVRIVRGLDHDHPDWTDAEKRDEAAAAITQYVLDGNGTPSDGAINAVLELVVAFVHGPGAELGPIDR